ncbi:MAG: beta-ketoacyl-ACP synthase II [Candidatus Marinimicrobia bacterium]|jgi:3-oxoacyl-[acyl-carrier-protein] synthase II|nr:beta-ketoacyl-ACP synthase II [Candidatus Neomarinimicrobiota bacterium]
MKKRVVITGMGVTSPVGTGIDKFWNNIQNGFSGIGPITQFDTSDYAVHFAGEVTDINLEDYFSKKEMRKLDRFAQFALIASDEAIKSANFDFDKIDKERVGVIIASGIGGLHTLEQEKMVLHNKGPKRISPFFIPKLISDIAAGHVSIKYGLKGINYSVASACASSNHSIALALRHIRYGDADVVISGGAEATITPLGVSGFTQLRALSTRNDDFETASRPFDKTRDGFVIAEGSGIIVLEEYEHAKKRNAKIYAEIVGAGMTADAFHITAPSEDGDGAIRSMEMALKDGNLKPDDISYINAHGTSTPFNDKIETKAIKSVFGENAKNISISSTKSMTGHMLGATGAVEAIASIKAIENDVIPPTINLKNPDPECDLNYTPNMKINKPVNAVLSNTFGFGGHNSTLVFKKM